MYILCWFLTVTYNLRISFTSSATRLMITLFVFGVEWLPFVARYRVNICVGDMRTVSLELKVNVLIKNLSLCMFCLSVIFFFESLFLHKRAAYCGYCSSHLISYPNICICMCKAFQRVLIYQYTKVAVQVFSGVFNCYVFYKPRSV